MRTRTHRNVAAVLAISVLLSHSGANWFTINVSAQEPRAGKSPTGGSPVLPVPDSPFGGVIGRKASESRSDFAQGVTAPERAPNILLIMTDDTGFGAASTSPNGEAHMPRPWLSLAVTALEPLV